jgi:hypothetical protein
MSMSRSMLKPLVLLLAGAGPAALADMPAPAPAPMSQPAVPDATITLSGGVFALGIGYEWAHGTLNYQGHAYPFHVRGMSLLDLGAASVTGAGQVFNLHSLQDFNGNYVGTTVGSAVSQGGSLALMKNERGVTIRALSQVHGVRFNFSGNGMRILLDQEPRAASAP